MSTPNLVTEPVPALRLLPTPAWEPPYCDEGDQASRPVTARPHLVAPGQQALPLTFLLPSGLAAVPAPPRLRLVDTVRSSSGGPGEPDEVFDPQPTPRADLPDPRLWGGRLVQAMLEVDAGVRPVAQLRRWTSDPVYSRLRRRSHRSHFLQSRSPQTQPGRVWVRSLRVCEPADGVAEVSAVVQKGSRIRAVAVRLEGTDGRWRCTAVEQA